MVRPVHLLRIVLLRVLESNFPGDSVSNFNGHENSHPLELRVCLGQTPLKPKLLVGRLGVRGRRQGQGPSPPDLSSRVGSLSLLLLHSIHIYIITPTLDYEWLALW